MSVDWSGIEVEVIIAEYFDMLRKEISGVSYKKSDHRRKIAPLLNNRSEGSIEFKFQNISAVLARHGIPWIIGYKPRDNFQNLLEEKIIGHLRANENLENLFEQFANSTKTEVEIPLINFTELEEAPPERTVVDDSKIPFKPVAKVNYLEMEQSNKILGNSGEEIAYNYEKWRLISIGRDSLADKIEWVAKTQGDGLGYDILSRNLNGSDRYIEVKTTKMGKASPIFFSKREYDFSSIYSSNYFLYRIFNFTKDPKVFIVKGCFDDFCSCKPVKFKGFF